VTPTITRARPRPGDIRHSGADIGAIRAALGYVPRWTLRAGLEALIGALRHG
jgi:UDP-glucose 4-epimerase